MQRASRPRRRARARTRSPGRGASDRCPTPRRSSPSGTYLKSCCSTGTGESAHARARRGRRARARRHEARADAALGEDLAERAHHELHDRRLALGDGHLARGDHEPIEPRRLDVDRVPSSRRRDSRLIGTEDTVTRSDVSLTGMPAVVAVRTMPLASCSMSAVRLMDHSRARCERSAARNVRLGCRRADVLGDDRLGSRNAFFARAIEVEDLLLPDVALGLVLRDLADLADDLRHALGLALDDLRGGGARAYPRSRRRFSSVA